jgi:hypothetical protein
MIQKKEKLQEEESSVIASSLMMLQTIFICEPNMINTFYEWKRSNIDKHYANAYQQIMQNRITNVPELFMQGLISKNKEDREAF